MLSVPRVEEHIICHCDHKTEDVLPGRAKQPEEMLLRNRLTIGEYDSFAFIVFSPWRCKKKKIILGGRAFVISVLFHDYDFQNNAN